jgi:hypothetical protein
MNYRKLQLQWRFAEIEARTNLQAFVKILLADPKVRQHPKFNDVQAAAANITSLLPSFNGLSDELADQLDRLHAPADEDDRQAARTAALKVLTDYDAELEGADGLRDLQDLADEEYGGIMFFSGLQAALATLRREIETAA